MLFCFIEQRSASLCMCVVLVQFSYHREGEGTVLMQTASKSNLHREGVDTVSMPNASTSTFECTRTRPLLIADGNANRI
jgi:hypothetical protein